MDIKIYEEKMEKSLESLKNEYLTIRAGRVACKPSYLR